MVTERMCFGFLSSLAFAVSAQLDGGKRGMAEPGVDACDCSLEVMSAALRTFVRATAPFAYNFVFYFAAASPRSQ